MRINHVNLSEVICPHNVNKRQNYANRRQGQNVQFPIIYISGSTEPTNFVPLKPFHTAG